jgi:hypothetical protein
MRGGRGADQPLVCALQSLTIRSTAGADGQMRRLAGTSKVAWNICKGVGVFRAAAVPLQGLTDEVFTARGRFGPVPPDVGY